jgi:hypothetical protein
VDVCVVPCFSGVGRPETTGSSIIKSALTSTASLLSLLGLEDADNSTSLLVAQTFVPSEMFN